MEFFDTATFVIGISTLTCLLAKVVCLIWTFVRTKKVAALLYMAFLLISTVLPVVIGYTATPDTYAITVLYVGTGSAVIEAGLFIWLVRSLLTFPYPTEPLETPPSDITSPSDA
ncbi:MAG: hypothetical protein AAF810_11635 [Cyanobacteria bacterium P01_D01_bin.36]